MHSDAWPSIEGPNEPPPPYAMVTATVSNKIDALARAVRDAFQDAMAMRGRLRDEAFKVPGFSGRKFRLFMNNLIGEVADARYMEIGLFQGASFCSAVFKNRIRAVGIDNWTEYGAPKQAFMDNLARFQTGVNEVRIIEQDFRKVDYGKLGKFNVLFYDGSHQEKDQYDGILIPQAAMDDSHIVIVDDWNWDRVRNGTFRAFKAAKLDVDYSIEVRTTFDGKMPLVNGMNSEWHNGTIAAVVSRRA